jgi:hypothetical protein
VNPDPKPMRPVSTPASQAGTPPASSVLLPLASLAEALQPLDLDTAVDVAALCLELPQLDLTPAKGREAAALSHPESDGPGLASFAGGLHSSIAAMVSSPAARSERAAIAPATVPVIQAKNDPDALASNPADRRILLDDTPSEQVRWPELARYELPGAPWLNMAEATLPEDSLSFSPCDEPFSVISAGDFLAPIGPALDELVARMGEDSLELAEPASLFLGPGDVVPPAGDGLLPASARHLDPGWSARESPGSVWETFGARDQQPSVRSSGPPAGSEAGSDVFGSEMIGSLATRLLGAAERLEQAAQRLTHLAPGSMASLPRPFRGRVDG